MKAKNEKRQAGFSLFEVLAVLTLLGVVITVITASFLQSTATQQHLKGRLTALVLGEGKLAELLCGAEETTSGQFAAPYDDYAWESQSDEEESGMSLVAVTVKWSGRDGKLRQKVIKGTGFSQ
ncbi:MAG: prepilin-type N-terminal cleavage/methylation domain-containing protein [Bacillota bacterium]|jgi:prepilin-type N-terminal cleavage/methylation domain-containing protein